MGERGMKWLVTCFVAIGLVLVVLKGCGGELFGTSWNRKLTVTVTTPAGEVSGAAVQGETLSSKKGWFTPPEASGSSYGQSGEAVVVEVAPGRYLFALRGVPPDSFKIFFPGKAPLEVREQLKALREAREVPRGEYPLLVTFTDINDPKTVNQVDPADLAASFGPGFSLKSITLEITDEKVTEGEVEKVLGWISEFYDKQLDGNTIIIIKAPNRLANSLASGNFSTRRK
jgi:hypothetical protein